MSTTGQSERRMTTISVAQHGVAVTGTYHLLLDLGGFGAPSHQDESIDAHAALLACAFDRNVRRKVEHAVSAVGLELLKLFEEVRIGGVARPGGFDVDHSFIL